MPAADLSRTLGGILDGAVILALPGSPGGVRDGLSTVGGLLEHAAAMAAGGAHPGQRSARNAATQADEGPLVRATPITEAEVAAEVSRAAAGAVVTFAGMVRDHAGPAL